MTVATVRPIRPEEIDDFAGVGNSDPARVQEVKRYVEKMIAVGSMRPEWCFVIEEANRLRGRVAFWTLPKLDKPLDLVLLDIPWDSEDSLSLGKELLQTALEALRGMGVKEVGHVLDTPPLAPQWQTFPTERRELLREMGFRLERETCRFEWKPGIADIPVPAGLSFRSLAEVGNEVFIEAVIRVSEGTLDRRILHDSERLGARGQALELFQDLQQLVYDPHWWQLAYNQDDECIGLVMPAKSPAFATIGYIGVMPEQRGRGYIHQLLGRGTDILLKAGVTPIRADTDVHNEPMANAFRRAGYIQFATRSEYRRNIHIEIPR
ncbi:GNAT family N-acetyltransferase [Brevibacillus borstelensis]|uniref:GNAT family N-acetyltransferase n=1 Tax=Brevibacillus borstelensis TaxID=45462 RepID=UPI003CEB55E7